MNTIQTVQKLLPIARALVLRAGARHSQADVTDVQAMHDLACKLGAKCKTISDGTRTQFSAEAMKAELYDELILRHPGHGNQKTHGNRFGTGQAKESLRRLKDDKGAREKYKDKARGKRSADENSHTVEKVGINSFAILRKDKQRLGVASSEEAAREAGKRISKEIGNINRPVSEFPKGTGGKIASIIIDVENELGAKKTTSNKKTTATDNMRRLVKQI